MSSSFHPRTPGSGLSRRQVLGAAVATGAGMALAAALPGAAAATAPAAAGSGVAPTEWDTLAARLDGIQGVSTTPPTGVVTNGYTRGALLGNGDLGVVVGYTDVAQRFYFGRMEHWGTTWGPSTGLTDSCLSIANLTISSPDTSPSPADAYRMTQDIRTGEVRTSMQLGTPTVSMVSWTADCDNVFVTDLSVPAGSPDARITVALAARSSSPGHNVQYPTVASVSADGTTLRLTRSGDPFPASDWRSTQALAVRLIGASHTSASATAEEATVTFTLTAGKSVHVVTAVRGDARSGPGGPAAATLADRAEAAAKAITASRLDSLRAEHHDWWRDFWMRSYVDLGDPALESYYYGALYVLGASTRAGKLPPALYGGWITTDLPNWENKYFLNYDYEATFYGAGSANRPGLLESYCRPLLDELPYQRNNTAQLGYQGACYGRKLTPQHIGRPAPAPVPVAATKNPRGLTDQKSNGSFGFMPAIDRWQYYREEDYLRKELYPALKELAAFWADYMTWDGTRYTVEHSGSHENWDDFNPGLDLGFIRRVYTVLLEASVLLNQDARMRSEWQHVLAKLSAQPTGTYGGTSVYTLAEVVDPRHSPFVVHDQPINLEGVVHPAGVVQLGSAPVDVQRARDSLALQNEWGSTGNSYPKTFLMAARVGWSGPDLLARFKAQTAKRWRPSNLTYAQPGGGLETTANIEMLNSMLLTGEFGLLRFFPVWPAHRPASFTRLRAKGGYVVSGSLSQGRVQQVDVLAEHAGTVRFANPWAGLVPIVELVESDGHKTSTVPVSKERAGGPGTGDGAEAYTFKAKAGATYRITRPASAVAGTLAGAVTTTAPGPVDLTAAGTTDWVHYGLAGRTDRKADGGARISDVSVIGNDTLHVFNEGNVTYSWTDGAPTAAATATPTGFFLRRVGNGFRLTVRPEPNRSS